MIRVREAIIVEGKYDKIKISSILDGIILETHGFRIFKDKEQMQLIRKLAATRGLLVLTDSDSAGFVIRNYLAGSIPPEQIRHAYIPVLLGKEKRKEKPSKEGRLGVEGMPEELILQALRRAGVKTEECTKETPLKEDPKEKPITKLDLFQWGLSGGPESGKRRLRFLKQLELPEYVSANALVQILNTMFTRSEVEKEIARLQEEKV